jgi:fatty-acyl-CoA synthase
VSDIARAAASTVGSLFEARAKVHPIGSRSSTAPAGTRTASCPHREHALAGALAERGVRKGDRIAILSENRVEYLEAFLAASRLGAIVACQNWRLAPPELEHCLDLVAPKLLLASPRHAERLATRPEPVLRLDAPRGDHRGASGGRRSPRIRS